MELRAYLEVGVSIAAGIGLIVGMLILLVASFERGVEEIEQLVAWGVGLLLIIQSLGSLFVVSVLGSVSFG